MTIQIRLSLLFAVVVELLLGGVFIVFYLTVSADRERDYFAQLEAQAFTVADVFFNAEELDKLAFSEAKKRFRGVLASSQVIILDSLDRCIYINDSALAERSSLFQPIALDSDLYSFISRPAIAKARKGDVPRVKEQSQQSVYLLHPEENNNYLIIIRARDDAGMNLLGDVRFVLCIAAACVPFVAFGVGLWFARNALSSVTAMTKAANAVSLERLGTRLPEGNGKDEISFLAQAFNRMFARLENSYQAQRQFIDHASHELRTPLTIMEGEVSLALLHDRTTEVYRSTLSSVQTTIQRLSKLTTNLLLLAKIEAGQTKYAFKPVPLDEIIFHAVDAVQIRHSNRIITAPQPDSFGNIHILCNRELLETAFMNVLDNALKFSASDTPVEISVSLENSTVFCRVRDVGMGISQDALQHIFTPFYRASDTSFVAGTGIGLALVKAILDVHQGSVNIASQPRNGTTLTVALPIV
ncbi:MAG: HAMP domain-containing histidine kinase [Candidatus Kapabacteria bacterium]|jgi:signal transduction histidine kinase|nr:HAMP domain-containing histidine kinase [Candidatus Kapabacteria bacterium]